VAKGDQLSAQMMGANAGLHADRAGWHIGQPVLKLAARELRFKDDGSTPVEANQVENSLANVDADHGRSICFVRDRLDFRVTIQVRQAGERSFFDKSHTGGSRQFYVSSGSLLPGRSVDEGKR